MARLTYGGSIADWSWTPDDADGDVEPAASGTVVTFWDSLTGGNQYGPAPSPDDGTGLLSAAGAPIDSVTVGDNGYLPEFQGPDLTTGVTRLAADASGGAGPRFWVAPNDPVGPAVAAAQTASASNTSLAFLNTYALLGVQYSQQLAAYPPRPPGVGGGVLWVGPVAPPAGGTGAVNDLDIWVQTTSPSA